MRQVEVNSLNMIDGVLVLLHENEKEWKDEEMIVESVEYIEKQRAEIAKESEEVVESQTEGITDEQRAGLEKALDMGYKISLRLGLFARKTSNLVLLREVSFSRSTLDDGKFPEIIERLKLIAKRAEENKDKLLPFKITPQAIKELKDEIAKIEKKPADRKSVTAIRAQSNAAIRSLLSDILNKLKELDDEIEGLCENERFVEAYFAVRRTDDRRGRGGAKKEEGK